jgi:hypothetical protein
MKFSLNGKILVKQNFNSLLGLLEWNVNMEFSANQQLLMKQILVKHYLEDEQGR